MLEWLQTNLAEMRAEQRRLVPVVGRERACCLAANKYEKAK